MEDLKRLVEKMDQKLDKMDQRLDSVDITLVSQAADLKHHIYRTELAEQRIETLHTELKPVKKHVEFVNAGFKIVGMISTGLGLIVGIGKLVIALF